MKRCVFFFNAKTQFENLGDLLISRELLRLLKSHGDVRVLGKNTPIKFLEKLNIEPKETLFSAFLFYLKMVCKAIFNILSLSNSKVFLVLNPGGFSGDARYIRGLGLLIAYAVIWALRIKIIRLGASIDSFTPKRIAIERLKNKFIYKNTLRDSGSLDYAKKHELGHFEYFPDFAYLLAKSDKKTEETDTKSQIVLSFRSHGKEYNEKIVKSLFDIVESLPNPKTWDLIFLTQVDFDQQRNTQLSNIFSEKGYKTQNVTVSNDIDYACDIYSNSAVVLSNRLHVLLLALRSGAIAHPLIDKKKNAKIDGMYADENLSNLIRYITLDNQKIDCNSAEWKSIIDDAFTKNSNIAKSLFKKYVS